MSTDARAQEAFEEKRPRSSVPEARQDVGGHPSPAARALLNLQRTVGNRAVRTLVQRHTPAPAAGAAPPGPAPPAPGTVPAGPGDDAPVLLPPPGAGLRIPLLQNPKTLVLTKEDFSEFNLGVGKLESPAIPLGESGIQATVSVSADQPVRLANASVTLSPIEGLLDAGDVEKTRKDEKIGAGTGATIGGAVGGVLGGPLGGLIGQQIGKEIGSQAAGDHFVRFTLQQGALTGNVELNYNPTFALTLSAVGFSWFFDVTATLSTALSLVVAPQLDFKGSSIALIFRDGRLSKTEFDLNPVVTPSLGLVLSAAGQLRGSANLLPILGGKGDAPPDDAADSVELTAPFQMFRWPTTIGGQVPIRGTKGSPFEVLNKSVKAKPGSVTAALIAFLKESPKQMPFTALALSDGPPQTGKSPSTAIPLIWWKPPNRYLSSIRLPKAEFGKRKAAARFPHREYTNDNVDIGLGVNNWPYVGMTLKKQGNSRGGEVKAFVDNLALHGITIDPAYQMDHVVDLVFAGGTDSPTNLWPLRGDVNVLAGGKWSNGTALVEWVNRAGDPPFRTAPSAVPIGRWFVIKEIRDPTG
ncbi:hypothetical protein ACVBEQ_21955 [Nakamurella sp. GG22]